MVNHKIGSKNIGYNLKKIRLQKRLAQIDVTVTTNLHRTYISRIETGKARVTFNVIYQLVSGLEITSGQLVERGSNNG